MLKTHENRDKERNPCRIGDNPCLSPKDAAEYCGLHPETFRQVALKGNRNGTGPVITRLTERMWGVCLKDLDSWLAG